MSEISFSPPVAEMNFLVQAPDLVESGGKSLLGSINGDGRECVGGDELLNDDNISKASLQKGDAFGDAVDVDPGLAVDKLAKSIPGRTR